LYLNNNIMRKIKEFKTKVITKYAQMYADFLIERMKESTDTSEFEIWFTQGLYLDLWCEQNHGIYLN